MAGALVGGAFLSGFVNVVLDRLISPEAVNLVVGKKLDSELVERLKTALCAAEALLADAEWKQFHNPQVKMWLDSLKDAVYKADDLIDYVVTKAATHKEVSTFWPRSLFNNNSQDRDIVNRIHAVVRRIEDLEQRKYILGLGKISGADLSWRTASTSLEKGNTVYGRENDKEAITKIISENIEHHQLSVIPIVGMGGVGKTTLAQWLYNNDELMKGFDLKVWVCVSEKFDILEITKVVIEGITKSTCSVKDLNSLQLELKEKLSKQRFFIVLDDVWSYDSHAWTEFITPFQYENMGSKILVTTRSKNVASVVKTGPFYFLNELSEEYCWLVFADNACIPESNGSSKLEEIGRKIVRKCKGLPLAAETLGRLLRQNHDDRKWNAILISDIWEFPVEDSKIIPALLISYYHLPESSKRCFVHCSLFPKDYKFEKDELILLWMAENLLRAPKRGETLEEIGCKCFDDLASRLFFKKFERDNDQYFVMHDMVHDLAIFLAKDFYCRVEELDKAEDLSIQTRHLSYGSLSDPISKSLDSIDKVESLRTFMTINLFRCFQEIESATCDMILSKLKNLRVLSFYSYYVSDTLPDSIGELIHLRYLDLSETNIAILPESLCDLYNLQTLKLFGCRFLEVLPSGMHKLVNLRHLDIWETPITEMPGGMSKLKHLRFLSCFYVGKLEDNGIKELGELSNFRGSLCISKLENIANSDDAMEARIMDKIHIDELSLCWSSSSGDLISDTEAERDVLSNLQPHHGLKDLTIDGYRGTRFPNWVEHSSYRNMTSVTLGSCSNCFMLPALGQLPCLVSLSINCFEVLEIIDDGFYKNEDDYSSMSAAPFPSLENLSFEYMPCWEVWRSSYSNAAFPRLKTLQIMDCPRLKGDIPIHLPTLETVTIHRCRNLEFLKQQQQQQMHQLQELRIYASYDSLNSFPLEAFPNLEVLLIEGCTNLESLSLSLSLPQSQPQRHSALRSLQITDCPDLVSLPPHMNTLLPSLQSLELMRCPKVDCFPEGGLPPTVKSLRVDGSEKQLSSRLSSMGPMRETLTSLVIDGLECEKVKSFPKQGLLPQLPSLTTLRLQLFSSLETLECDDLHRLTSLHRLEISSCQELENMEGERLPTSLSELQIYDCDFLSQCCKTKHPQIWPKISHITNIWAGNERVQ